MRMFVGACVGLIATVGTSCLTTADIVIGSPTVNCNPFWPRPTCDGDISGFAFSTACNLTVEQIRDKAVIQSTYHASVSATYDGWHIDQYNTDAYAAIVGVGTATEYWSASCGGDMPVRCTNVDLAREAEVDSGSLLTTSVAATAALAAEKHPILYPFLGPSQVQWNRLSGPDCQMTKNGFMEHSAAIAVYEARSSDNFCCGKHYETAHAVSIVATGVTTSSHSVRMTRCASGTGNTILDIDIDTNIGLCTDFTTQPPAAPFPRFGWAAKVVTASRHRQVSTC